jgi:hypothetical protein
MHKWKHLLKVIVILCLAIILLPSSIASADGVTVSIDAPAEVDAGTDFIARVDITDVTDFDAANYDITYDSSILEVTDVTDGVIDGTAIPVGMWGFVPAGTQGTIRVIQNIPGISGVSGSGYLSEIHFHVVGSAGSTSGITMSNGVLSDNTATEIPATWLGDSVHVAGAPGPGGGGGGGGGGGVSSSQASKLKLEMMGKVFSVSMTDEGVLEEALEASCPDGAVSVRLGEGTQALDSEGGPLEMITVEAVPELPEMPEKGHIVGAAYEFGPEGATFDPEIELIMQYDPADVPEGVSEGNLFVACYESESGECVLLPAVVDTEAHTVSVCISHFTIFAVIGKEEAAFHFANLLVSPTTVDDGESVAISVEVTNTGGLEGSCTVTLLVDDAEETTQELTLASGVSEIVTFSVTRDVAKTYSVRIDTLTGDFTVTAPSSWAFAWVILGGVLGLLAVAATVFYFLVFRRRKAAA